MFQASIVRDLDLLRPEFLARIRERALQLINASEADPNLDRRASARPSSESCPHSGSRGDAKLGCGTRHFRSVEACRAVTMDVPADVDDVLGVADDEIYATPILGFEGWYRRTHPDVLTTVALACGSMDIAADATDEAFARALARWPRVSEMGSPTGWVVVVALNHVPANAADKQEPPGMPEGFVRSWRRRWDLNPRSTCADNTLAGCPIRPLWHVSVKNLI